MAERSITVEEVITQALLLFPEQDSRDEMVFTEWAWQALRDIGPSKVDTFEVCLEVCDLQFEKPCGFIADIDINLLDENKNILDFEHTMSPTLSSDKYDTHFRSKEIKLSEGKDYYNLSDTDASRSVKYLNMIYYGYPLDENDNMLIEENMEEAIIRYIEWMWTRRERRRDRDNIPMSEERSMFQDWINTKKKVKAQIKMPSPAEADTIFRKWVSAIPNFQNKPKYRKRR